MHHAALYRPGANDRHLDDNIIEPFWFHPGQHVDLRAAFNLKRSDAIALLQHRINAGVFKRHILQIMIACTYSAKHIKAFANAGEHAEREYIDLHQAQCIDIILVPFDERSVSHGAIVDRHHLIKPILGEHETADMLREMPGEFEQLIDQYFQPRNLGVARIKACFFQPVVGQVAAPAAPDGPR